jgi:hypothetical protein
MKSIGVMKRTAAQAAFGHLLPQGEKEEECTSCFLQIAPQLM